ncbi:hypothetical protein MASR2M17_16600 [Aminivibrio sp.]
MAQIYDQSGQNDEAHAPEVIMVIAINWAAPEDDERHGHSFQGSQPRCQPHDAAGDSEGNDPQQNRAAASQTLCELGG